MKKFFESLREHSIKITNFKKKIMKLLTKEQQESYENARIRYICKKKLKTNVWKIKNIVIIQENIKVLHIENGI